MFVGFSGYIYMGLRPKEFEGIEAGIQWSGAEDVLFQILSIGHPLNRNKNAAN